MQYRNDWVYGVTTVPARLDTLLPRTLSSLEKAGFDRPRLFVDGVTLAEAVDVEKRFGLEVTARTPRIRTFGNFMLGLAELYIRTPTAQRFAMFQDDFVTYRNLRGYLDRTPHPPGTYLNLYTFPKNQAKIPAGARDGWYPADGGRGLGAVALVFTRDSVRELLTQQHTIDRPLDPDRGHRNIDGGIWNAFAKVGVRELVHSPSLVQHIGLTSTLTTAGDNHDNQPQAMSFRGEDYDALQMLPAPVPSTPQQKDAWERERSAREDAIHQDSVRFQQCTDPKQKAQYRGHLERYKTALRQHLANAPL